MDSKITFVKNYTRDTTLIIQEMWFKKLGEIITKGLGQPYQMHFPIIGVDYIVDGVVEIWENKEAIDWIQNELVERSHTNPDGFLKELIVYEAEIEKLKEVWKQPYLNTKQDIANLIQTMDRLMTWDIAILYLGTDNRAEKRVHEKAAQLRSVDSFFASNDFLLRNSLVHLFPSLSPYALYLSREEVEKEHIPPLSELAKRRDGFISTSEGYRAFETLAAYQEKHPTYLFHTDTPDEKMTVASVHGQTANKGVVSGKVIILKRIDQLHAVEDGVVIVSPMTTPALVPGLRKAAAIVTDEGGMLCHAAVVSRELGIPCIIGTKIATKVFKDGDMVEVDANNGIVRKL